jgi:hypothetical protein
VTANGNNAAENEIIRQKIAVEDFLALPSFFD